MTLAGDEEEGAKTGVNRHPGKYVQKAPISRQIQG